MATIGKVRAVFTASTSGLTAGVNTASASMRKMQSDVAGLRSGLSMLTAISGAQLFASIASGASQAVRSLVSMGAAEAEVVDATNKMASRLGMTYGEMAGLAHAGALVDVSMETIGAAATKADVAFVKAANGSKTATAAFSAIGLSVEQLNGMSAAERFDAIAQAISQLPTEAQKSAAAVALFGKSGAQLLPIFENGAAGIAAARAEAERFGLTLTGAQANDIDGMGDSFDRAKQAVSGVIQQVVAYLAPAIKNVVTQFSDLVGSMGGANIGQTIGEGILQGARFFAQIGDYFISNLSTIWQYVSQVGGQWASVWGIGQRIADFLFAVAKGWESIFQGVAGIVSTVIGEALAQVGSFASNIPGFGALGDSMKAAGESLKTSGSEFFQKSVDAAEASGKALKDAWSGREPEKAGEAIAGPLTTSLDEAIARSRAAAAEKDVAGKQKLDVKQTATIDDSKVRESVKGLDVRSAEGMKEMLRLVRGGGQDVQQRIADNTARIAANTEDMGLDIEEADLPQTAGAY
jgi:hypothetical protein